MGISAAQIRKDLSHFGEFGKQGTGYSVSFLIKSIKDILNINQVWDIAVVGAGDLGHAISRYQGFKNRGFRIAVVFDVDPQKIGQKIGDLIIEDFGNLFSVIQSKGIKIAMLTVPAQNAQSVANELVKTGITAILNYAPTVLSVPADIRVEYIDPINQLQHMTYYLG